MNEKNENQQTNQHMKLNFKETIHQRTDEELNRITKDYHFYSAAERAIAQNEITRRESMETDLQKTMARKTDEELMSIAKDMVSYSVEERLVAVEEQQARKKMVMGDKQIEDKKKNDLKPIHYLIIVAVIGAVIFIWNYQPTTYVVEYRLGSWERLAETHSIPTLELSDEASERLATAIIESLSYVVTTVYIERETVQNGAAINGLTWAASNVDAPGRFARNPEDFGRHFQWNRRRGWSTTNRRTRNWDISIPAGTAWYAENDPCPTGWRVPTPRELRSLQAAGSQWANLNGVEGRLFGDAPNQVFLPAAGRRFNDGRFDVWNVYSRYSSGIYWSSTEFAQIYAQVLEFGSHRVSTAFRSRAGGYSVRCVKGNLYGSMAEVIETDDSEGVIINGVRWATRNVDAPGTFAPTPESAGMFFQWGRLKGWNTVDEEVENWDRSRQRGVEWYEENDPCPPGWRVPMPEEMYSLYSANSEWTTLNGVEGRLFGDAPNQIFLPAVGWRLGNDTGSLNNTNQQGLYWTDLPFVNLIISSDAVKGASFALNPSGYSVRCVAKN